MNSPSLRKQSEQKTKLFQKYPRIVNLHEGAGQEPCQVTDVGVSEVAEGVGGSRGKERMNLGWVSFFTTSHIH